MDAGVLFALKPQLQFDIACGSSINRPGDRFFTTFGVFYILK